MRMEIELMTMADLDRVSEIERLSFSSPWPRSAFADELTRNEQAQYVVAKAADGGVMGYAGMWLICDEAHVTNVAVHPGYRRSGVGRAMMAALMRLARARGARRMTLEVRVSNHGAQALYMSLGFEPAGIRPRYYEDNKEDALIMWVEDLDAALEAVDSCEGRAEGRRPLGVD
ncbi:MAG: ribosomal protein S18-alanine N-acetyltransferase [Firmicutes bacterium]|nr:ribosomal protein S18-alanine N-acetyltransferase [Bacillota bacterium]